MPDFITRMLQRTFGLTEVVQPLLQPAFAEQKIGRGNMPEQIQHPYEGTSNEDRDDGLMHTYESQPIEEHSWNSSELNTKTLDKTESFVAESFDIESGPFNCLSEQTRKSRNSAIHSQSGVPKDPNSTGTENLFDDLAWQRSDIPNNKIKPLPSQKQLHDQSVNRFDTSSYSGNTIASEQIEGVTRGHMLETEFQGNPSLNKISTKEQSATIDDAALMGHGNRNTIETVRDNEKLPMHTEDLFGTFYSTQKVLEKKELISPREIRKISSWGNVETSIVRKWDTNKNLGSTYLSESQTIKVTIGRVDVRAMTQQQSPVMKHLKTSKPGLSLEEYLKRRSGAQK